MREEHTGTITATSTATSPAAASGAHEEYTLLLERDYPVPIESVWAALVEPAKLERWLAKVGNDGHVGGSFAIDFGDANAGGEILAYDPPRALAFEWGEGGEPSVVRFDLEESERGTRLRLTHTRQSAKVAAGKGCSPVRAS